MLFNTLEFAIFMICVVLAIKLFKNKKLQLSILVLSSYLFYYFSSGFLFVLLLFSSLLDFYVGKKIFESKNSAKRKFFLILSLIGNLGILAFFKYADFAIQIANYFGDSLGFSTLPLLNIVLPIGISFFTFQTMSYTIDIYRRKMSPTNSFLKFMLFVSFFPQLVAGPIIRASTFLPQLNKKRLKILPSNLKLGLTYISWGLVKKIVFADNIGPFVDSIFTNPLGLNSLPIMLATIAFGIQIYCDFSAYSDIAIGTARILGFKFPKNFNKPYFACNPSNFWNRWHISLSSWVRDYLYIPLGGNRKGKIRTYLNLLVTMVLMGLWHGASWNFVLWGFYHGAILVSYRFISKYDFKINKILSIIITQYLVFLGWLIFRLRNFEYLGYCVKKFIFFDFNLDLTETIGFFMTNIWVFFLIVLFCYIHFFSYRAKDIIEKINSWKYLSWFLYLLFVILLLFLFSPSLNTAFIYFQF